jgi:tRNA (guanosine-2'-O-)-methyltransferase
LVFGNEHDGISDEVKSNCDGLVHIPMLGFTESFNISVAASILLFELIQKVEKYQHPDFYLSNDEKQLLKLKWYKSVVKNADLHQKAYQKTL